MSRATFFVLLPFTACQPSTNATRVEAPTHASGAGESSRVAAAPRVEDERTAFESNRESARPLRELATPRDPELDRLEQLEHARSLFQAFIERAGGRSDLEEPLQRARERLADIEAEMQFVRQGLAERRGDDLDEPRTGEGSEREP